MTFQYSDAELLPLSGIQHFVFCRRQWALIHVERQWQENALTAEGRLLHKRADDPFFIEKRGDVLIARAVPVASHSLGLTGICDVVEFTAAPEGVQMPEREGRYLPAPVEYKRGRKKYDRCDEAQLCAQAMCLEEMLLVEIAQGSVYYAQIRRREPVEFSDELRTLVRKAAAEMHQYFRRGHTPRVRKTKACRSCSLVDICLPDLQSSRITASRYIQESIEERLR
jgi:CRISPR-associated exonuclease Cas4